MYCKHRFGILKGFAKSVVSENVSEVAEVAAWLPGTDVEAAMDEVEALEAQATQIKNALSKAKKNLAKAMRD
jgi:F0F1-type ATP synthase epsilon subunit